MAYTIVYDSDTYDEYIQHTTDSLDDAIGIFYADDMCYDEEKFSVTLYDNGIVIHQFVQD